MIKVSLVILAGLGVASLLRRHSAALRHWVLAAAIVCAGLTPLIERVVPSWDFGRPEPALFTSSGVAMAPADFEASASPASREAGPTAIVPRLGAAIVASFPILWLAGTIVSLGILMIGLGRLAFLAARATPLRGGAWPAIADEVAASYGIRRPIAILLSTHPTLLLTWGVLRPSVMLPAGATAWPEDRIRIVLRHELAHIRRSDWVAQMIAEIVRAAYWFNPLLWLASRRLRLESEQACDDAVLGFGVEGSDYATHLLGLARAARAQRSGTFPSFPAPAMARPGSLERRVRAMLNTRLDRRPTTGAVRAAISIALLAVAAFVGGFRADAQSIAKLSGSVVDPTNSGVPKAAVVLTNVQTDAKYEVRTDESGRFEFVALPAGEYTFETLLVGFEPLRGRLTVGSKDQLVDLSLRVGTLQETVTVRGKRDVVAEPPPAIREAPAPRQFTQACTAPTTGGNIRPPAKIKDVRPIYPLRLQAAGIAGDVTMTARIGTDGDVVEVTPEGQPNPDLAAAAMDAVRQWQFTSTLLNCAPVDVKMKVLVRFEIEP